MTALTLADFLRARLGEDEAVARAAAVDQWGYEVGSREGFQWASLVLSAERDTSPEQDEFIDRHTPARVLADVEAKRRIVDEATNYTPELEHGDNGEWAFDVTLRLLALPHASHPDYRNEWRP